MSKQLSIAQIFLRLFVIAPGIALGGGLYETSVVMPLWDAAPPDSVIAYYQHNVANPQFALNAGGRFWIFLTPTSAAFSTSAKLTADIFFRWNLLTAMICPPCSEPVWKF